MKQGAVLAAMALLTACSGGEQAAGDEDPSKLSAELEVRASEIEQRADEAAAAVERESEAELQRLQAASAAEETESGSSSEQVK